jgi:DNA repair protein RecO (recombination protein O)
LLDRFTYEEGQNLSMYNLLADTLSRLSTGSNPAVDSGQALALAVRYYEIKLLDLLGFRPQLFQCVKCGVEIQAKDQFFSAELGGVLCPGCGVNAPGARPVSMQALKYLRHFQRSRYTEARRAHITSPVDREMEALMQYYFTYLLERGLNSPAFLRRMRDGSSA